MKIKFDKKYIEDYQMDRVKEDAKFFSEAYTLGDLRREFENQTGIYLGGAPEVVKAEITAMDSGWALGNKTTFNVWMLIDGWSVMYKVHFFIDKDLQVDTRDSLLGGKLYEVRKFTEA